MDPQDEYEAARRAFELAEVEREAAIKLLNECTERARLAGYEMSRCRRAVAKRSAT